jgi:hypothetical protein
MGGPSHGFTDGFGIASIVLRRLHIRFDQWWGDQPHVVAMFANTPGPVMGTPTGFHPDAEWWYIRDEGQQFTPGEALPEYHMPGVIHLDDVKHECCDIDPEYIDGLRHWTRLPVVNGCPQDHNHSGSSKPF